MWSAKAVYRTKWAVQIMDKKICIHAMHVAWLRRDPTLTCFGPLSTTCDWCHHSETGTVVTVDWYQKSSNECVVGLPLLPSDWTHLAVNLRTHLWLVRDMVGGRCFYFRWATVQSRVINIFKNRSYSRTLWLYFELVISSKGVFLQKLDDGGPVEYFCTRAVLSETFFCPFSKGKLTETSWGSVGCIG